MGDEALIRMTDIILRLMGIAAFGLLLASAVMQYIQIVREMRAEFKKRKRNSDA